MDGARFANAVAHLGCAPADVTWRAGVDALSFGFVKNGGMSAEALVFFDPTLADATLYRRKRAGHLLSKGRYLAAQMLAMLDGDLWLDNARAANAGAAPLAQAAGDRLIHPVEANEVFLRVTARRSRGAARAGLRFLRLGAPARPGCVTSWDQREARRPPRSPARSRRCERPQPRPQSTRPRVLIPFAIVTLIWGSTWLVIRDQLARRCRRAGR